MFLFHKWLELNINTRHKIAAQFGIVKRGATEVVDNVVTNDGYKVKEIEEALNVDAVQTYLGSDETNMEILWRHLVMKIEDPILYDAVTKVDDVQPPVIAPKIETADKPKNKGGRPRKNA